MNETDIELNYIEKGKGKPFILLHGNEEDGTYFSSQIEYFSKKFRVIAVDTRGHGKSPRGEKPFTIRQFTEDLYHFMNRLSIEKADILGFSDGGNIALTFAIIYPERVDRLILNGANLNPNGVKLVIQIPIIIGYRIASLLSKKSKEAKYNAEMLGLMVNDPNINTDDLKKVKSKTLVIAGSTDMIKDKHTKMIGEKIPNASTVIIEGNHFIANRNPDEFNKVVDQFLN